MKVLLHFASVYWDEIKKVITIIITSSTDWSNWQPLQESPRNGLWCNIPCSSKPRLLASHSSWMSPLCSKSGAVLKSVWYFSDTYIFYKVDWEDWCVHENLSNFIQIYCHCTNYILNILLNYVLCVYITSQVIPQRQPMCRLLWKERYLCWMPLLVHVQLFSLLLCFLLVPSLLLVMWKELQQHSNMF